MARKALEACLINSALFVLVMIMGEESRRARAAGMASVR